MRTVQFCGLVTGSYKQVEQIFDTTDTESEIESTFLKFVDKYRLDLSHSFWRFV